MKNILIIAPLSKDKFGLIIEMVESIKKISQEVSISVLVSLDNYYIYYNNPSIDGLIISPKSIFQKLFFLPKDHYDIAWNFQNSLIWRMTLAIADVKRHIKLNKATKFNETSIQKALKESK